VKMRQYPNKEGINQTNFTVKVTAFCPLGGNYRTMTLDCKVAIDDTYVDMLDLEHYFQKELNGGEFTAEALAEEVYTTLKREYNSPKVSVLVHSDTHLPIDVIRED